MSRLLVPMLDKLFEFTESCDLERYQVHQFPSYDKNDSGVRRCFDGMKNDFTNYWEYMTTDGKAQFLDMIDCQCSYCQKVSQEETYQLVLDTLKLKLNT